MRSSSDYYVEISAGKWWVGKSTTTASKALHYVHEWKKTLIIDMDGGRALARVFGIETPSPNIISPSDIEHLSFVSVQAPKLFRLKAECKNYDEYIAQFPNAYGLVAFHAMVLEFFWVYTDVEGVHKLATFSEALLQAKQQKFEKVLIDIEPTSWFQRLLSALDSIERSMKNLSNAWFALKTMLSAWPDIKKFVNSPYIQHADSYVQRLLEARETIRSAQFTIVTTAEPAPVEQATGEVLELIRGVQGHVGAIVINNYGRPDVNESIEQWCLEIVQRVSRDINAELHVIPHDSRLFGEDRHAALREIGERIATMTARPPQRKPKRSTSSKPKKPTPTTPTLSFSHSPTEDRPSPVDMALISETMEPDWERQWIDPIALWFTGFRDEDEFLEYVYKYGDVTAEELDAMVEKAQKEYRL